jgi:hypothetical protein
MLYIRNQINKGKFFFDIILIAYTYTEFPENTDFNCMHVLYYT